MRLIITRHGRTIENVQRQVQGHSPGTLSDEGKTQAEKLGSRLMSEKIAAIFSSDLKRASDTAIILAKYHPDAVFCLVKELRERDYASLVGKTWNEVDWKNIPADVETPVEMEKRVKKIIDEIFERYKDKTVLIVGHGGLNKMILNVIMNRSIDEWETIEKIPNASVTIFEIDENKKHTTILLNDIDHLK